MKRKTNLIFILMSVINYGLIVVGILMGRHGIFVAAPILMLTQIVLTTLNAVAADTRKHHIILSIHLFVATILTDLAAYPIAYYIHVGYDAFFAYTDEENLLLESIITMIGCSFVCGLSALGIIIKDAYRRSKDGLNGNGTAKAAGENGFRKRFILMSIVNYLLVIVAVLLSRCEFKYAMPVLAFTQILWIVLNAIVADSRHRHIILSVHLMIATIFAFIAYNYLGFAVFGNGNNDYYKFWDIMFTEVIVIALDCLLVIGLSILGIVLKNRYSEKKESV